MSSCTILTNKVHDNVSRFKVNTLFTHHLSVAELYTTILITSIKRTQTSNFKTNVHLNDKDREVSPALLYLGKKLGKGPL